MRQVDRPNKLIFVNKEFDLRMHSGNISFLVGMQKHLFGPNAGDAKSLTSHAQFDS